MNGFSSVTTDMLELNSKPALISLFLYKVYMTIWFAEEKT